MVYIVCCRNTERTNKTFVILTVNYKRFPQDNDSVDFRQEPAGKAFVSGGKTPENGRKVQAVIR
jgi:hypothetical protein